MSLRDLVRGLMYDLSEAVYVESEEEDYEAELDRRRGTPTYKVGKRSKRSMRKTIRKGAVKRAAREARAKRREERRPEAIARLARIKAKAAEKEEKDRREGGPRNQGSSSGPDRTLSPEFTADAIQTRGADLRRSAQKSKDSRRGHVIDAGSGKSFLARSRPTRVRPVKDTPRGGGVQNW